MKKAAIILKLIITLISDVYNVIRDLADDGKINDSVTK